MQAASKISAVGGDEPGARQEAAQEQVQLDLRQGGIVGLPAAYLLLTRTPPIDRASTTTVDVRPSIASFQLFQYE